MSPGPGGLASLGFLCSPAQLRETSWQGGHLSTAQEARATSYF